MGRWAIFLPFYILDLLKLFVVNAHKKKESKKLYSLSKNFKFGSENRPCMRGLKALLSILF